MSNIHTTNNGHPGARNIAVWDPLVRLIHWGLALIILLNGTILDEDGKAHIWLGYIAVGLVIVRLIWGIIGSHHARFYTFPPNPQKAIGHLQSFAHQNRKVYLSHNPAGSLMAYNFWATILILGVTGYMMSMVQFFGVDWVEDIHEFAFGWLLVSIVLHLSGIALDTWRSGVPLIRAMIDGRKRIPKGRTIK